jgi:DNA-binding LacI/PurR family transcriptional regulator
MTAFTLLSPSEQVAAHLRMEILRGVYGEVMPGTPQISSSLGIDRKTITTALELLEREGLLASQGAGKCRRILMPKGGRQSAPMHVMILTYDHSDRKHDFILDAQHRMHGLGFKVSFASRSLYDLKMDVGKVARFVGKCEADAWIVIAGSREVLEWFASRPAPAFALFGRHVNVPIASAGTYVSEAIVAAVGRLFELGHRRIVMLCHEERRKPIPGQPERNFLKALESHGIPTGSYNLPDWEPGKAGFHRMLESLFLHSPPTAFIIDTPMLFNTVRDHLSQRGILAPEHISLICATTNVSDYQWCIPSITLIQSDTRMHANKILRWAENLARGKENRRKWLSKVKFVEGGTIGPAPQSSPKGRRVF